MLFSLYLVILGILAGIRLRFFCFLHPVQCLKTLFSGNKNQKAGGYSPFRALTVALAGTLGVGNITGVAAAIALGGSGALFWMWVSALCTMLIKYAEVIFAVKTRELRVENGRAEYHGGPMRYLPLLPCGRILSVVFCVLCVGASFLQGNLIQTNAAVSCLSGTFSVPPVLSAAVLTAVSAVLIFGGRERISAFTEKMIPLMTALYLLMSGIIIAKNLPRIPAVFAEIFKEAFSFRAVGGAGSGTVLAAAMRHGCAKGVFSHEAGCGTAPISHAGAETDSPHRQGLLGIAEVAVDTLILCTVTGVVLLLSGVGGTGDYAGTVLDAFSVWFGDAAKVLLTVSIVFYAFSTLVCWSFYGTECLGTLVKPNRRKQAKRIYLILFSLCTFAGAFVRADALWTLSDGFTMAMTALNATAVVFLLRKY